MAEAVSLAEALSRNGGPAAEALLARIDCHNLENTETLIAALLRIGFRAQSKLAW